MPSAALIEARDRIALALTFSAPPYNAATAAVAVAKGPPEDTPALAVAHASLIKATGPHRALLITQERLARTT